MFCVCLYLFCQKKFQSDFFSFQLLCAVTNSKNIRKKTKYEAFSANDSINDIKTHSPQMTLILMNALNTIKIKLCPTHRCMTLT